MTTEVSWKPEAFILPHFNYCSETWHFCSKKSADKLEMVNKRALRFVFREKSTPYEELLNRIGLPSLREQRLGKILSTVFKILASDAGPASLRDFITVRRSTYNLRGNTIVDLPKVKSTTYGLRWLDRNKLRAVCLSKNSNNFAIFDSISLKLSHFTQHLSRNNMHVNMLM